MQYVGHLDLHKSWERSFRRSGLQLSYSLGFHPQPRINLACALPLGFTSQSEIIDAWIEDDLTVDVIKETLNRALPPGLNIHSVEKVDFTAPSLQTQVISSIYLVTFLDDVADLNERIQCISSSEHIYRQRRGKSYDLRPLIESINLYSPDETGRSRIRLELSAREAATGRPEEVLDEIGIKFENTRIHREKLTFRD